MKHSIYTILLTATCLLTGCDDFLSEVPNRGGDEVLNSGAQIDALFNNSDYLVTYAKLSLTSSDDFGYTTAVADAFGYVDSDVMNGLTWNVESQRLVAYGDEMWSTEYSKIFLANLIINEIDKVTDISEEQRTDYLANAHFIRALANWQLVSLYAQPYDEETLDTPGLPLKQTTSYEEDMHRATLKDTYAFILADLDEAYKTTRTDIDQRWLVSRPAVEALRARIYLSMQDYKAAATHAAEALKSQRARLIDYNTLGTIERTLTSMNGDITVTYSELYGMSPVEFADYPELYYASMYEASSYFLPSSDLLTIYNHEDDLRFRLLFVKNGTLAMGLEDIVADNMLYTYFVGLYDDGIMPAAPTVPEMLLTRAEALARQGQWKEGMNALNELRAKRIRTGGHITLTAASQEEAIRLILEERHREMPFMMRWQDIRRLAYNETPNDDIALDRIFYKVENNTIDYSVTQEYTLPVKSKCYAQPIADIEIARSGNQLVQNDYD